MGPRARYPNEEEILFPPLTTLEVIGTHVDGAVIVVELRASLKPPGTLKAGTHDLAAADKERERSQTAKRLEEHARQVCAPSTHITWPHPASHSPGTSHPQSGRTLRPHAEAPWDPITSTDGDATSAVEGEDGRSAHGRGEASEGRA